MIDLLGIVGSRNRRSRTASAVEISLKAAEGLGHVNTALLHLADHDLEWADGRRLEEYGPSTREALDLVIASRAFVVGTPVYRGGCSGVLKNLLDLVPRGRWQADVAPLENRPVALVATGASPHHYLSADQELRPLMAFFGAYTVGTAYLYDEHFANDGSVISEALRGRLAVLGQAAVELSRAIDVSRHLCRVGPQLSDEE